MRKKNAVNVDGEPILTKKEAKKLEKLAKQEAKKSAKLDKKDKNKKQKNIEIVDEEFIDNGIVDQTDDSPAEEMLLYIIVDKAKSGMYEYLRGLGICVSEIFTDIKSARGRLFTISDPVRIVVVDSGTGQFIAPTIRKDLIDMMGLADEDTKFTVFYTDSILKSDTTDTLGKSAKDIEWIKYNGTVSMAANIMSHNEKYVYSDSVDDTIQNVSRDILNYVGEQNEDIKLEEQNRQFLNSKELLEMMQSSEYKELKSFEPHI